MMASVRSMSKKSNVKPHSRLLSTRTYFKSNSAWRRLSAFASRVAWMRSRRAATSISHQRQTPGNKTQKLRIEESPSRGGESDRKMGEERRRGEEERGGVGMEIGSG